MKTLDDKVTEACHRIEELYNETEGRCYVSFSGGKDSTVLLALIKLCEEVYTIPPGGIPAVYSNTGIELSVTVDFVRWVRDSGWYQNVQIIRPEHSFDWVIKNKGKPLMSKLRSQYLNRWQRGMRTEGVMLNFIQGLSRNGHKAYRIVLADKNMHMLHENFKITASEKCCTYMKKKPFHEYAKQNNMKGYATGLRADEGGVRMMVAHIKERENKRICTAISDGVIQKAPIIDWTDSDVEEFIKRYNVPLSKAYTEYGFDRTGCMACPYSKKVSHDLEYLYKYEPNRYKAAMYWLKDVYIAQDVRLPFDEAYERERENMARII